MSGPWDSDGNVSREALLDCFPISLSDEEMARLGKLSRPMLSFIIDLLERAYELGGEEATDGPEEKGPREACCINPFDSP